MNKIRDMSAQQLRALLSATKYPAIETFHGLGDRGRLTESHVLPDDEVLVTEKVDGTNAGIVLFGDEVLLRSREEWLTYSTDVVRNPSLRIVEAVLPIAQRLAASEAPHPDGFPHMMVLFGEAYGGNINAAKTYTAKGALGFRLFDALEYPLDVIGALIEKRQEEIAAWRDAGGQIFAHEDRLRFVAEWAGVDLVPRVCRWGFRGPESIASLHERMGQVLGETLVALDGSAGHAEGVVMRTRDRRWIRKARFEDYQRALRGSGHAAARESLPAPAVSGHNPAPVKGAT